LASAACQAFIPLVTQLSGPASKIFLSYKI
jgi:hypothetical protein